MSTFSVSYLGNGLVPNLALPLNLPVPFPLNTPVFTDATLGLKNYQGDTSSVLTVTITASSGAAGQILHTGGVIDATWVPPSLLAPYLGQWGAQFYFILTAAQTGLFLAQLGGSVDFYVTGHAVGVADPLPVMAGSIPVVSGFGAG